MAFLVAINGQFSPFISERISTGVTPVSGVGRSGEVSEFKQVLQQESDSPEQSPAQHKLDIYQKNAKAYQNQKRRDYAKDIMSFPVKYLSASAPASEALAILKMHGFRHLPITDHNDIIIGMISDREVAGDIQGKLCQDVMIQKVIVCDESASVNEIAMTLLREKLNALPIINHKHQLTGIITLSNILDYVIRSTPFLNRA
jgi:CBS domain-containing membrane protein